MYRVFLSAILLSAVICSFSYSASSETQIKKAAKPNYCWSPSALKAQKRERFPRYRVKGARVPAPKVNYSPLPSLPKHLRGSIRRVDLPPGKKLIALTLDLCEAPWEIAGYDGSIIDYLRQHNIKATFFAGGKWMMTHQERTQQLVSDPLFEMGNHAWSHKNFRHINTRTIKQEIVDAQKAYQFNLEALQGRSCQLPSRHVKTAPAAMKLFRFPYGACRTSSLKMAGDQGVLSIQWDVSTGDPVRGQTARRIARHVLRSVKPGSIIIAHANGRGWNTAKALPLFIPKLIEKGYKFVTVSELLQAGKPVISQECYDVRPGDSNHYGLRTAKKRRKARRVVK